jgi:methyltransferase family protein
MNAGFARYLSDGFDLIEGWLSPTTAHIMATLADEQTRRGIAGDIAEIGVHHGKSFLALANSTAPGERLFAIDVFEDQHKNVDNSGNGSREVFLANFTTYAPGRTADIIPESSLDLPAQGWPKAHARSVRFFSIDGSHTREATLNDLRIAEQTATPGGLIVLDDVLSSHWLGVISGLFDYLSGGGTLIPTVIIPNKLLLASDALSKSEWIAFLREHYGRSLSKSGVDLFGHSVDIIEEDAALYRSGGAVIDRPQSHDLAAQLDAWKAFSTSRVYRVARAYMLLRGHSPPV